MPKQTYQLPCPCGHVLHAVAEQAGTELRCGQCGAAVSVPSLQGLRKLPSARSQTSTTRTAPSPSRSRSTWPVLALGAAALGGVAFVLWLGTAPRQRAGVPRGRQQANDSAAVPDRGQSAARPQLAPATAQPADAAAGHPSAESSQRAATASDLPAESAELVPVEYLDLVDFGALTHSQEPVGVVLIKLAGLVHKRAPAAQGLAQRMREANQAYLIHEQLELTNRQLGEQRRMRLLAASVRGRVQEEAVLQAAVEETRQGLSRLIEIAQALEAPQQVREIGVQNFRRRIEQQREQIRDPDALAELGEADRALTARRAGRLDRLQALSDDDLIAEYAQWIFLEGWVERAAEQMRTEHKSLRDRFQIPVDEAEKLLQGDEQLFRDWMARHRPAMIRRDLEALVAMHGNLLVGNLDEAGQQRLRDLCVRWNVDPTEAPVLLRTDAARLTEELDRRAARRMRDDLVMWLRMQTAPSSFPGEMPSLEELSGRYQLEPDLEQVKSLADADPAARLDKHHSIVTASWRRALEQMSDLERTVLDAEKLQSASRDAAARAFRGYLEQNVTAGEALLMRRDLPDALRAALEENAANIQALLQRGDLALLDACADVVRLRLLPGTAEELLDESASLEQLLKCNPAEARQRLEARDQTQVKQLARDATLRRLREELSVVAGAGTGDGSGAGAGLRQQIIEKYGIRGAEARRLLALPDAPFWQWNLDRLAGLSRLPDREVVARAEQLVPQLSQDAREDGLEHLGAQQREELEAQLAALRQRFTASFAAAEQAVPWATRFEGRIEGEEHVQRGLLQPFLQPYSGYLWDASSELRGETAPEEGSDAGRELASYFPPGPPAPSWVGLLRNGLIHGHLVAGRDGAPARLTLFLPSEADQLTAPRAAQRAFDHWYGVARLMVRWVLQNAAGGGPVRVQAFAYFNEYETCTLWLCPVPWEAEMHDAPPPPGKRPLDLQSWRAFLAESRLDGLRIVDAEADAQLALIGRRLSEPADPSPSNSNPTAPRRFTLMGSPVEVQDLAVAYRAVFYGGHNEPYQSLDAARHPALARANFGGDLENTRLGSVLLDADLTFKFITSGLDPFAGDASRDRRSEFQQICRSRGWADFEPAYDRFVAAEEGTEMLQVTRFWLKLSGDSAGQGVRFDWRASPTAVEVIQPFFLAEARKQVPGGGELPVRDLPPWTRQAIDHLNQYREAYEELFPVLEEVRSVGLLLALCQWMKTERVDQVFDLDELLDEPTALVPTPRTRLRRVFASVVDAGGNVQSFNCSDIARALEAKPLERVEIKQFEEFAYVAAASLALARKWEPDDARVSQAYSGIYGRVMEAMAQLDRLVETEAIEQLAQLRGELYNVPQQRWTVGCAWTSTGGIDLALPPARRGPLDFKGRHSSLRRSPGVVPSRSPAKPATKAKRLRAAVPAASPKQAAEGPENDASPERQTDVLQGPSSRAAKPELKLDRRGKRIRLQRRTGSRYSRDF